MAEITESQLLELKDAFQLYSKGSNDGKVDIQELGKLFLSLGQKLSEEELRKMLADLGEYLVYSTVTLNFIVVIKRFKYFQHSEMDSNQTLDFPEFLSIMAMRMKDRDSDTDLREAFSLLDEEGTGYVKAAELFEMLVNIMGEKEDEVQGMLSEANVGKDGLINYEDFIRIILK